MTAHLGGAYASGDANTIMPDVWGYLLTRYPIRRVLDVGCGYGQAMRRFAEVGGCDVVGIDGDPACVASDPRIRLHDFILSALPGASLPYDLAWSSEFLEHVDEKYLPNLMSAFQQARLVVVTHGEPGQPGHHHVNCRVGAHVERAHAAAIRLGFVSLYTVDDGGCVVMQRRGVGA